MGVGLSARAFTDIGMDSPWYFKMSWTCVKDPVSVTADNAGCGTNGMMVYYALYFEDSDRDDADGPTSDVVPRE